MKISSRSRIGRLQIGGGDGSVLGTDGSAVHAVSDAACGLAVQARNPAIHEGHLAETVTAAPLGWQEDHRQALKEAAPSPSSMRGLQASAATQPDTGPD